MTIHSGGLKAQTLFTQIWKATYVYTWQLEKVWHTCHYGNKNWHENLKRGWTGWHIRCNKDTSFPGTRLKLTNHKNIPGQQEHDSPVREWETVKEQEISSPEFPRFFVTNKIKQVEVKVARLQAISNTMNDLIMKLWVEAPDALQIICCNQ